MAGDRDVEAHGQLLDELGQKVVALIKELLAGEGIVPLSVEYRVKRPGSIDRKLANQPGKYGSYLDLTDLLGVRVITYFSDVVDTVADRIRSEFEIDDPNSVDKRAGLQPDQFGYMSLHYVMKLNAARCGLFEYQRFRDVKFEIQIRSILQHAWAEIEHDLGYKVEASLPRKMRRRFSRLAGLLELADDEFISLRDTRDAYVEDISRSVEEVAETSLMVDQTTIAKMISYHPKVHALDEAVAKVWPGNRRLAEEVDSDYAGVRAAELLGFGIDNIDSVARLAEERVRHVAIFAKRWLEWIRRAFPERDGGVSSREPLNRGIGLLYLAFTIAAERGHHAAEEWIAQFGTDDDDQAAAYMRELWRKIEEELGEVPRA